MLHCFVSLFSLTSYKKIFIAGRKCYSFNTQFSVFIGDCMPLLHSMCVCVKISICNRWELEEFKTTCKLVFNRFWKPYSKSLPCIFCTNQTKQNITFERNHSEQQLQQKNFNAEIHLPNSNWFDHLCFFAVKTVEVFEAIQHILTSRARWKFQSVLTHY